MGPSLPRGPGGSQDYDEPAIDDDPDDRDYDDEFHRDGHNDDYDTEFMDPGGNSALRAGVRNRPCPTCKAKNRLTDADARHGYQCDSCADKAERGVD